MKKIVVIAISVLMLVTSCDSYTASGAMFGGMIGSAVGGLTGGYRGSDVGMLVGAAAGAAIGASAHEAEVRRAEQRYYDEVYNTPVRPRDEKAERVARYHANTRAKYSGGQGYRLTRSNVQQSSRSEETNVNNSGYTDQPQYDDRIDFK